MSTVTLSPLQASVWKCRPQLAFSGDAGASLLFDVERRIPYLDAGTLCPEFGRAFSAYRESEPHQQLTNLLEYLTSVDESLAATRSEIAAAEQWQVELMGASGRLVAPTPSTNTAEYFQDNASLSRATAATTRTTIDELLGMDQRLRDLRAECHELERKRSVIEEAVRVWLAKAKAEFLATRSRAMRALRDAVEAERAAVAAEIDAAIGPLLDRLWIEHQRASVQETVGMPESLLSDPLALDPAQRKALLERWKAELGE